MSSNTFYEYEGFTFTYIWRVENFSYCYQKNQNFIHSPIFTTECFGNSKWCLELYPRGRGGNVFCYLKCVDPNPKAENNCIRFKIVLKSIEKVLFSGESILKPFRKDDIFGYDRVKKTDYLNQTLSNDTLIINCHMMLRNGKEATKNFRMECKASTIIGVEQRFFQWNFAYPISSSWSLNEKLQFYGISEFELTIEAPEDTMLLKILRMKEPDFGQFSKFKITVLDARGRNFNQVTTSHLFDTLEEKWEFELPVKKTELMEKRDVLLKNNCISLLCEFSVSNGFNTGRIEKYSYNNNVRAADIRANSFSVMRADFSKMLRDKKHTDVTLISDATEFRVHKSVLCARSPVFDAMFDHRKLSESQSGSVNIQDINPKTLSSFLEFIYTGVIDNLDVGLALDLLIAADKYQVDSLKEECSTFLKARLCNENVCDVLLTADSIGHDYLKTISIQHIKTHSSKILISQPWQNLITSHPALASEVLHKFSSSLAMLK